MAVSVARRLAGRKTSGSIAAPPARRRRAGGFNLIEATIALAMLAVGMLALLAVQARAMHQARWARHVSQAATIARDQMEFLRWLSWDDGQLQPTAWTPDPPAQIQANVQTPDGVLLEQAYNLEWRIVADPVDANLRQVDVRVTWVEADASPGAPVRRFAISGIRHDDP
jgi:type II secretory pathway pseudopilin PulG